ncbi:hypothetical protein KI387_037179, partial [Taxus chinensis]
GLKEHDATPSESVNVPLLYQPHEQTKSPIEIMDIEMSGEIPILKPFELSVEILMVEGTSVLQLNEKVKELTNFPVVEPKIPMPEVFVKVQTIYKVGKYETQRIYNEVIIDIMAPNKEDPQEETKVIKSNEPPQKEESTEERVVENSEEAIAKLKINDSQSAQTLDKIEGLITG